VPPSPVAGMVPTKPAKNLLQLVAGPGARTSNVVHGLYAKVGSVPVPEPTRDGRGRRIHRKATQTSLIGYHPRIRAQSTGLVIFGRSSAYVQRVTNGATRASLAIA
jgi:hypothetical protein